MVRSLVITILRHGMTEENKQKQYIGWSDVRLCEEGREILRNYAYSPADLYVTSDLNRCIETVALLYDTSPTWLLPELREMNFGVWEKKTYEQLKDNPVYQQWLDNYEDYAPPNGESYAIFTERVDEAWEKIMRYCLGNNVEHVVIVTHGGVIRYLLEKYAPIEKPFWEWSITYGKGYTLHTTEERVRGEERCSSLQEVPFKESANG
ncbi:histidine phosphatase family protein [Priestia taiwanensis]|nr:histidine phosphatase family protein [Priestia taiwanensis]